jgi:hypothetical protein
MARGLMARASRDMLATAGILAVCAAFYTAFIARTAFRIGDTIYFSLFDDAMVSMRYARNLAHGDGLVWNPGESAVEGYTNFLWTLWMSLLHVVRVPEPKIALGVMVTGAVALLAATVIAGAVARRLTGDRRAGHIAMLLTGLSYPLAYWTLRGLEVGFVALLVVSGVLLTMRLAERESARDLALLCALGSAACLTRADAVVPFAVLVAWSAVRSESGGRLRVAVPLGATLVVTLAAHTAFRRAYYGDWLPNTYYLKVEGVPLGTRVERGVAALTAVELAYLAIPLLLALAALLLSGEARQRGAWLLVWVIASICAYSMWVGGDAWEWMLDPNRYVTSVIPVLAALAGVGLARLLDVDVPLARRHVLALVAGCVVLILAILRDPLGARETAEGGLPADVSFPGYLVLALLGIALVRRLARRYPGWRHVVVVVAIAFVFWMIEGGAYNDWIHDGATHVRNDEDMTKLGLVLRETSPPGTSVAVIWAGSTPYYSATTDCRHARQERPRRGSPCVEDAVLPRAQQVGLRVQHRLAPARRRRWVDPPHTRGPSSPPPVGLRRARSRSLRERRGKRRPARPVAACVGRTNRSADARARRVAHPSTAACVTGSRRYTRTFPSRKICLNPCRGSIAGSCSACVRGNGSSASTS